MRYSALTCTRTIHRLLLAEDGTHTFDKYPLGKLEAFKSILRPDDHVAGRGQGNSRFSLTSGAAGGRVCRRQRGAVQGHQASR